MSRGVGAVVVSLLFVAVIVSVHFLVYRILVENRLLSIQRIVIEGNRHTTSEEIIHLTGLRPGMGMFDFSWDVVIPRLTNRPHIRFAAGERVLPWVVRIRVEENFPVGTLVVGTNAFFIDAEGWLAATARVPSQVPRIEVNYPLVLDGGRVQDEWVLLTVRHLAGVTNVEGIERIRLDRTTGAHVWLRGLPTDIWVGHEVLDATVWQRVFALEKKVRERNLNLRQINLHRESAIGYK